MKNVVEELVKYHEELNEIIRVREKNIKERTKLLEKKLDRGQRAILKADKFRNH